RLFLAVSGRITGAPQCLYRRCCRRHAAPALPPGGYQIETVDEHWAEWRFDPDPALPVQKGERKTDREEMVRGIGRAIGIIAQFQPQLLGGEVAIFPFHRSRRTAASAKVLPTNVSHQHQSAAQAAIITSR